MREAESVCASKSERRKMLMLLEQVYLFYISILFIELAIITVIAIGLLVALVVTIRKNGKQKHSSAS